MNRYKKPNEKGIAFHFIYAVGHHIWFYQHCAQEWIEQVEPDATFDMIGYNEAYHFAKNDPDLKEKLFDPFID